MRRIPNMFERRGLESEEERRERVKRTIILFSIPLGAVLLSLIFSLIYWHSQQIDGKVQIMTNESLLSMGTETTEEERTIDVSSANSLYNYELSAGDLAKEFFTKQKTIELLNSMYDVMSDIKYVEDVSKTTEVVIPKGATYLPVNKDGINDFQYYSDFNNNLTFNLMTFDVEMYSWRVYYKLNSGREINEVYVVMILDHNMLLGKTHTESNPSILFSNKGAMEVISYQISE